MSQLLVFITRENTSLALLARLYYRKLRSYFCIAEKNRCSISICNCTGSTPSDFRKKENGNEIARGAASAILPSSLQRVEFIPKFHSYTAITT